MKQAAREVLPAWARYSLSLFAVAAATFLRLMMDPWMSQGAVPYVTFNAAVALAAFLWGRGPGILATVAGSMACEYFIIPPRHTILLDSNRELVPMGFFIIAGLLVSILSGRLHASRQVARERARSLSRRADELQRERSMLARAEQVANLGSWEWDIATDQLSLSEQACRIFGLNSGESGTTYQSLLAVVSPEDREAVKRAVDEALAGRPLCLAYSITRRDSSVRRILAHGDVDFDTTGEPIRMVGAVLDITERDQMERELRQTNERLSLLLNAIPVGVTIAEDPECRVITTNPAGARMFEAPSGANVSASAPERPAHRYFHLGRELQPEEMPMQMAVFEDREVLDVEIEALLSSGRRWTGLTCASPLHDRDGRVIGGIAVVRDITERKRMEEALAAAKISAERAKAAAEAASMAKDHFLAVLSHELRNPLNPVLAIASMLRRDPRFDADTREQLEIICRNAEMEARLIDDLLDVTRIERGKIELDRRPIDLSAVVHRAIEVCTPEIQARNLEFGADLGPTPYLVNADAARLQQVFWNLIKNAIKFTPAGGRVGIRCRRDEEGFAVLEVNDSGEGIEPEALRCIFDAFEQAERSITRQFGGLGLGLTISKALVEMHGGSIRARSEGKGKGATFTVRLPLLPAEGAIQPVQMTASSTAVAARPLQILLVEDHGDTARVMRRLLTADGHEVQIALDVATALKLAGEQTFDLLLSDLGLPDGSGLDLIRAIRAKGIDLPGIALTGFGQEKDVQQSREAGFSAHVTKPVSLERLEEAIAKSTEGCKRNSILQK